jgi:hypothetical protein
MATPTVAAAISASFMVAVACWLREIVVMSGFRF